MRFDNSTRDNFLSGTVYPKAKITLRRWRLAFDEPYVMQNDGAVLSAAYASEDYYDDGAYRVLWGDSCVHLYGDKPRVRFISDAAYNSTPGAKILKVSRSTVAADTWAFGNGPTSPVTWGENFRLGVYPHTTPETFYLWFFDSSADLRVAVVSWGGSSWSWDSTSTGQDMGTWSGAAIHPVAAGVAFVVGYDDPCMWVRRAYWSGAAWTVGDKHVIWMSDNMVWTDAQWSDAVVNPADSNEIVISVNLLHWGSAYSLIYSTAGQTYSQPREMFPSAEQWGNLRVRVSAMNVINSRIWAVTTREPVASDGSVQAAHAGLISSPSGRHWRDDGFIGMGSNRGKLLYSAGDTYCYVAGNASVAKAEATYKLGTDLAAQKYEATEVFSVNYGHSGPSSAPEISGVAVNDDESLTDSGLLEAGNRIELTLAEARVGTFELIGTGELVEFSRVQTDDKDLVELEGLGLSQGLVGAYAYRPPAAKVYASPYSLYSNFRFENGNARQTVRTVNGTWLPEMKTDLGTYALHCKKSPALSLIPHSLAQPSCVIRLAFQGTVSIEGFFVVVWYEDEDNYWKVGIYDDEGTKRLIIGRVVDGVHTNDLDTAVTGALAVDTWYTLYVECKNGRLRGFFNNSNSYDYSSPTASVSYDTTQLTAGPPQTYHVGLAVEEFQGWEGATYSGTVTDEDWNVLEDISQSFGLDVRGMWVTCKEQERRVADRPSTVRITVDPGWSDEHIEGEEYGVYPEEAKDGPGCWVREFFLCEGFAPHTVSTILESAVELAGMGVTDVFADGDVPAIGSSSPIMREIDVEMASTAASDGLIMWASTVAEAGDSAWAGTLVSVGTGIVLHQEVEWTYDGTPSRGTVTVAQHPLMATMPGANDHVTRIQANHEAIIVSCDGHFLTAFPVLREIGGYVAKNTTATATRQEFGQWRSIIWDTNEPATSFLSRLLQGLRAKIIERRDGTLSISRFDDYLGDLGAYTTPLVEIETSERKPPSTFIEMVGAEKHGFYVSALSAKRWGLRYERSDNPTLVTQDEAVSEARRLTGLYAERAEPGRFMTNVPDPAAELEDSFEVDSIDYRIETTRFAFMLDEKGRPNIEAEITARREPTAGTVAIYGTTDYDDGDVYG